MLDGTVLIFVGCFGLVCSFFIFFLIIFQEGAVVLEMLFQELKQRAYFKHCMDSGSFLPGRELKGTICPNVLKQIKSN